MRIGKQDQRHTAISTATAERINVRGRDLSGELIGGAGFTEFFWLLVTGSKPNAEQLFFTDACLVAIAEHGLVPSVQAARMTLAAAPEAWQGAVAAGLLGVGSVIAGSTETAGRLLVDLVAEAKASGAWDEAARSGLARLRAAKEKIPGLGHPQHSGGDPRAERLLWLADERGTAAEHVRMLRLLEKHTPDVYGRPLPVNVSGAIPAVMLDVGFPAEAMRGLPILARTAGLIAHLYEETQRPIGFVLSAEADRAIVYDGPATSQD
jgi:citrate synthase